MRENFRPVTNANEIAFASFASEAQLPSFTKVSVSNSTSLLTKVQKSGLRYEKRVQDHILNLCREDGNWACVCNPWIMFGRKGDLSSTVNFCQPDCLLVAKDKRKIIIVEIKLSHTGDSWRQLRQLYEPVLRHIYPASTEFSLIEISKWFDPHTPFPETFYYEENIFNAQANKIAIHIYKPRGRLGSKKLGMGL